MKRNQWPALLFAALLFFSGAAVGALAHRYYSATVVNAKSAEDMRARYISEMRTDLKLSPGQVNKLETILDETKAKMKAVRDQYRPEMLAIRKEQISRVKSILKPDQIPKYEQLVAKRERHAREQEDHDRQEEQRRAAGRQNQAAP